MGWFGYGLYDGDETQTCHLTFIKQAIPSLKSDDIFDMLGSRKTKIPQHLIPEFKKGIPNILRKIKFPRNILAWDEDNAIEWQMLLSLFVDNNLGIPRKILVRGMLANHVLLGKHAEDFNEPSRRRAAIKRFMKKVDAEFCSVKARQDISKVLKSAK